MISSISISTFRCFLECVVNIFGWAYLVWSDETFSFEGGRLKTVRGTRQKAGFVYRLLFIELCGVVNLSFSFIL